MTAPVSAGFPDFGRRRSHADADYINVTGDVIGAATSYGPYYVGDVAQLGVDIAVSVNHIQISFEFYLEPTLTTLLEVVWAEVRQGGRYSTTIQTRGPYVKLVVTPTAAGTTYDAYVWSTSGNGHILPLSPFDNILVSVAGTLIAAGGSLSIDCPDSRPGPASLSASFDTPGNGRVILYARDVAGTLTCIASFDMSIDSCIPNLWLPPTAIRFNVQNFAGVGRRVYAALTVPPHYW